jgi:hypothetical protein
MTGCQNMQYISVAYCTLFPYIHFVLVRDRRFHRNSDNDDLGHLSHSPVPASVIRITVAQDILVHLRLDAVRVLTTVYQCQSYGGNGPKHKTQVSESDRQ